MLLQILKMNKYYKHGHRCGSGYLDCLLKVEPENKITIYFSFGWMGDDRIKCEMSCTLLPVSGPYYIIRVDIFKENINGNDLEHELKAYFDTYIFNEILDTEWCKYPIDDVPIGLYAGNGCMSTEIFQIQMFHNKTVLDNVSDNEKFGKVIKLMNGLKYENIDEKTYNKWINIFSTRKDF